MSATSGLLTEIDHIAIAVRDLEAAIAYYREAFGAEVHHREVVDSDGVEEALIKVADSYIQLTAATRPRSRVNEIVVSADSNPKLSSAIRCSVCGPSASGAPLIRVNRSVSSEKLPLSSSPSKLV